MHPLDVLKGMQRVRGVRDEARVRALGRARNLHSQPDSQTATAG